MISVWSWAADAVLVVLLSGTLAMAIRLDKALRMVRRDRSAFEALINNLGSATTAVKLGIQALRAEAEHAAEQIGRRSEDADKMATDLSFLIEAADRAGLRLEAQLQSGQRSDESGKTATELAALIEAAGQAGQRLAALLQPSAGFDEDSSVATGQEPVAEEQGMDALPAEMVVDIVPPAVSPTPAPAPALALASQAATAFPDTSGPAIIAVVTGLHERAGITTRRSPSVARPQPPGAAEPGPTETDAQPIQMVG